MPAERMHRRYGYGAGAQRCVLRAAIIQDERPVVSRRPSLGFVAHCPRQRGSSQRRSVPIHFSFFSL